MSLDAALANEALLAPCDLAAIKAAGVTFADSLVERVIEERAKGDPRAAETLRAELGGAARRRPEGRQARLATRRWR